MLLLFSLYLTGLVFAPGAFAQPSPLIGQWTFDGANPLAEPTGNWGPLTLQGNASIVNGKLDVNSNGSTNPNTLDTATGWAYARGYTGARIREKSLVSWRPGQGRRGEGDDCSASRL